MIEREELKIIVNEALDKEPDTLEVARHHPQTLNYLVGKVMQKTRGRADPVLTVELIRERF